MKKKMGKSDMLKRALDQEPTPELLEIKNRIMDNMTRQNKKHDIEDYDCVRVLTLVRTDHDEAKIAELWDAHINDMYIPWMNQKQSFNNRVKEYVEYLIRKQNP